MFSDYDWPSVTEIKNLNWFNSKLNRHSWSEENKPVENIYTEIERENSGIYKKDHKRNINFVYSELIQMTFNLIQTIGKWDCLY